MNAQAGRLRRLLVALALGAFACSLTTIAFGDGSAAASATTTSSATAAGGSTPTPQKSYSKYEAKTIAEALKVTKSDIEPAPEGKVVEEIILQRLDVFEKRDPLPNFLITFFNWFHVTSKPFTIERELLLGKGDVYSQELVDETARNLRDIRQLSVVLTVPLKGSTPDRVKLLVITKDIWSLRLNSNLRVTSQGLEYLLLQPSEENLAGLHQSINAKFVLDPATYAFGFGYKIPRIADSRISAAVSANFIVNRHTGAYEGTYGSLTYGQPLYSTQAKWSWGATAVWLTEVTRRFVGLKERVVDSDVTPGLDHIPYEYKTDQIAGQYFVTRSFGRDVKHDFTVGIEAARNAFRVPPRAGVDPRALADFETSLVPVSDTRVYPFIQYESYAVDFMSAIDLNTLGLQEDFRLGHSIYVKLYPVTKGLGSSRDFMGSALGGSYTFKMGDGLGRVYAEGFGEADTQRVYDAALSGGARLVSPRFGIGRLVVDGFAIKRFANFLNKTTSIGGSGRLRGYPSGAFIGENAVAYNIEYRSRPLELWTVQAGGVLFYDSGAAFDGSSFPDMKHSVGLGLRVLFPQLDRVTLRVDWGLPLKMAPDVGVTKVFPGDVVFTFGQAFSMPVVGPPSVVN